MTWTNNNAAQVTTWGSLYILEQSQKTFDASDAVLMQTLTYFVPGSSVDARRVRAKSLAFQLHNMFTIAFGATLEPGVTKKKAVDGMIDVMMMAQDTIQDLSDSTDESYSFQSVELGQ